MNRYHWLEDALLKMPGARQDYKEEWGWFRYRVGGKMFAATCRPGPQYKGYDCRELISLKYEPRLAELFRQEYSDVVPGFYCDKRCWNSVFLDGEVPDEVLRDMCRASYELVFVKLPKKVREEIQGKMNKLTDKETVNECGTEEMERGRCR